MEEKNKTPQFIKSESFFADENYVEWLSELKRRVLKAQLKAASEINVAMLTFYWTLGKDICSKQEQYGWGAKFIDRLSLDLRADFPSAKGFSRANLYNIRRWYLFYSSHIEVVHQAGRQLEKASKESSELPEILKFVPWRHHTVIISKCDTIQSALFYIIKVIEGNLSRNELEYAIDANLFEHAGKSLNNFAETLPQPQNELANEIVKDPYNLEFINIKGKYDECDLENKLARNITRFLLELGKGFAYVGRQIELDTPSGKAFFPDMVFYHTRMKCYVVIELKVVDFKPEFIGKLNFYVSAADELLKDKGDNPSIGILLCKDKDTSVVEWSLRGINTPLGVASYQLQEVYERTMIEMRQNPEI